MRDAVGPVVITVGPELQSLAPSDVVERVLELLRITPALLIEEHRLERIVRPVGIVFLVVIRHAGHEDHDVAFSPLRLENRFQAEERAHTEDGVESGFDRGPGHGFGQKLRGDQCFSLVAHGEPPF